MYAITLCVRDGHFTCSGAITFRDVVRPGALALFANPGRELSLRASSASPPRLAKYALGPDIVEYRLERLSLRIDADATFAIADEKGSPNALVFVDTLDPSVPDGEGRILPAEFDGEPFPSVLASPPEIAAPFRLVLCPEGGRISVRSSGGETATFQLLSGGEGVLYSCTFDERMLLFVQN